MADYFGGDFDANEYGLGPPAPRPSRAPPAESSVNVKSVGRSNSVAPTSNGYVASHSGDFTSRGLAGPAQHRDGGGGRGGGGGGGGDEPSPDPGYEDEDFKNCWTWVKYPPLKPEFAAFCFIINMILPGIGTLIATMSIFCCAETNHWTTGQKCCATFFGIFVGLLQLALAIIVIGWIWSCIWGSKIFMKAMNRHDPLKERENQHSLNQVIPSDANDVRRHKDDVSHGSDSGVHLSRSSLADTSQGIPLISYPNIGSTTPESSKRKVVNTEFLRSESGDREIPVQREPSRESSRHPVPASLPPRRTTTKRFSALNLLDDSDDDDYNAKLERRRPSTLKRLESIEKFNMDKAPAPVKTPEEKERKLYSREREMERPPSPIFPQ